MKVLILHEKLSQEQKSKQDFVDLLCEAEAVFNALTESGHETSIFEVDENPAFLIKQIDIFSPDVVFNLAESHGGSSVAQFVVPAIIESMGIPLTGNSSKTLYQTTDKRFCSSLLRNARLPVPGINFCGAGKYIIKPVSEDASNAIDSDSVIEVKSEEELEQDLISRSMKHQLQFFAEQFIDGREFNISILGDGNKITMLPPAEIQFQNYPKDKPEILCYKSKWEESSFEYKNTIRNFAHAKKDIKIINRIKRITKKSCKVLNLKGYTRIDFRVDSQGRPFIIDVNANPCISPDAGLAAAANAAGFSYTQLICNILENAANR